MCVHKYINLYNLFTIILSIFQRLKRKINIVITENICYNKMPLFSVQYNIINPNKLEFNEI